MSNKPDCKWCGYSYVDVKQGREYLQHSEDICEIDWMRKTLHKLLMFPPRIGDHMTACDKTMGASHPCTCGASAARKILDS